MYIWPTGDQSPTPSGVKQCYLSENEDSVKECFKLTYMYNVHFEVLKEESNLLSKELLRRKIGINMILKSPHSEVCIYSSQIIFEKQRNCTEINDLVIAKLSDQTSSRLVRDSA